MRVIKFYILIQLFFSGYFYSQKYQDFSLPVLDSKAPFSNYNLIKVIDQRPDTFNMGYAFTDTKKNVKLVKPTIPLVDQLQNFIDNYVVSSKQGELLLQIRKLKFAHYSSAEEEIGYFFFRANLFSKENDGFEKIASIDTLLKVTNLEPSKNIRQEAGNLFRDFFLRCITYSSTGKNVKKYFEILKSDSIEKSTLKVYNEKKYVNGVYLSYRSFKDQMPDHSNTKITITHGKIKKVKIINADKSISTIDPANTFVVIEKGNLYVSTTSGFVPLYKKNDDFYFIDNAYILHDDSDMTFATTQFGLVGGTVMAASDKKIYFEVKLDHIDGSFMRVKNLATP